VVVTKFLLFCLGSLFTFGCVVDQHVRNLPEETSVIPLYSNAIEIVKELGKPQAYFKDPDSNKEMLYYCEYGLFSSAGEKFWLYNGIYYSDSSRGYYWKESSAYNCYDGASVDWKRAPQATRVQKYSIDGLDIERTTHLWFPCANGEKVTFRLDGVIGEDSSFAMAKLIAETNECADTKGNVITPISVELASGGGYLKHGYMLGETFRQHGVVSVIADGDLCASSCAVAFLGAPYRTVAKNGTILFHTPYHLSQNKIGKAEIDCGVPEESLEEMLEYYKKQLGEASGERLFKRTMKYCSVENGWTLKGPDSAFLFEVSSLGSEQVTMQADTVGELENLISKKGLLRIGMQEKKLIKLLGRPAGITKRANDQLWTYCETGYGTDTFLELSISDGKLRGSETRRFGLPFVSECTKLVDLKLHGSSAI